MDVAVSNAKVAKVAKSIAASEAKKGDATGLTYVPTNFGNKSTPITVSDIRSARKSSDR